MGNLFYRGATPTEIESMGWASIAYWGKWCEVMAKEEKRAAQKAEGG